jgi:hypothetical protein
MCPLKGFVTPLQCKTGNHCYILEHKNEIRGYVSGQKLLTTMTELSNSSEYGRCGE